MSAVIEQERGRLLSHTRQFKSMLAFANVYAAQTHYIDSEDCFGEENK